MSQAASVFTPASVGCEPTDYCRRKELGDFLVALIYNDNLDLDMPQTTLTREPDSHYGVITPLSAPTPPTGPGIRFESDGGFRAQSPKTAGIKAKNHTSQQARAVTGDSFGPHYHPSQRPETSIEQGTLLIEAHQQQEQPQPKVVVPNSNNPWYDYPSPHCNYQEENIGGRAAPTLYSSKPSHQNTAHHSISLDRAQDLLQPRNVGSDDGLSAHGGVLEFFAALSPSPPTPNPFYTHVPELTYNSTPFPDFEFGSWDCMDYENNLPTQLQTASSASSSSSPLAGGPATTMTTDHDTKDTQPNAGELSLRQPSRKPQGILQHQASARPRRPHSVVEKRYRAGINEKIEALRDCLESKKRPKGRSLHEALLNSPSSLHSDEDGQLQQKNDGDEHHSHAIGGGRRGGEVTSGKNNVGTTGDSTAHPPTTIPTRMNKAEVLIEAVEYIQQLEEENDVMMDQLRQLVARLCATRRALLPSTPSAPSCAADGGNCSGSRRQQVSYVHIDNAGG